MSFKKYLFLAENQNESYLKNNPVTKMSRYFCSKEEILVIRTPVSDPKEARPPLKYPKKH